MRLAFVRSEESSAVFHAQGVADEELLDRLKISAKAGSSSKNIILELLRRGLIESAVEWKFWNRATTSFEAPGLLPVTVFEMDHGVSPAFENAIATGGAPDILWVEGPEHPPHLQLIFRACESSFKLVYSKDWKPWKVEQLARFNLCLVDEEAQAARVHRRFPDVRTGVWDKLIDYDTSHFPLDLTKDYDVCYVAYFRERKNHRLLLDALARLKDRNLRTVLIGGDRKNKRRYVERQAERLGLDITFAGEVSKAEVNELVNRSRVGIMAAEKDAAPRVILEYMAANLPVVVNEDLRAGARYVDERSGVVASPEALHDAIAHVLDNYDSYAPRASYLYRFSRDRVIERFLEIMNAAGVDLADAVDGRIGTGDG